MTSTQKDFSIRFCPEESFFVCNDEDESYISSKIYVIITALKATLSNKALLKRV